MHSGLCHAEALAKLASALASFGGAKAERVGFEPTVPCDTRSFQDRQLSHSCTSPNSIF